MPRGNPDKLVPLTTEKAREIGSKGGKRSGEVKRERKLLSAMYADILAQGFKIEGKNLSLAEVASAIIARADAASVSMLKEIREATEGQKLHVEGDLNTPVPFQFVDPPQKELDASTQ